MVDVADDVDAGDYFEDADATGDTVDAAEDYLEDVDAADDEAVSQNVTLMDASPNTEDHDDNGDTDADTVDDSDDYSEDANAAHEVHDVAAECNFDGC